MLSHHNNLTKNLNLEFTKYIRIIIYHSVSLINHSHLLHLYLLISDRIYSFNLKGLIFVDNNVITL